MRVFMRAACFLTTLVVPVCQAAGTNAENLLADPSFEIPKEKDQFGLVFARWGGWKYEGDCEFRVGQIGHTGRYSCLLKGGVGAKIRVAQNVMLEPGRYRVTAFLRGLDIAKGAYGQTTEFMFDGQYVGLEKDGTFGWTKLSYVAEIKERKEAGPSFGLMAPGYFWIDDVSLEKVDARVPLTPRPVLDREEAPIAPPGEIPTGAVRCAECGYRNGSAWRTCYACGTPLDASQATPSGPGIKTIASFETDNPFSGGEVVAVHATTGTKALRIDRAYASIDRREDWQGYDFLKADLFTDSRKPMNLDVEIRDTGTRDYWTRVNYATVVPPGKSTLFIPVKQLYVGEKSRPGRMLDLSGITRLVFGIGEDPPAPLFVDNVRLERDDTPARVRFEGLHAFDFGTGPSPVMEGFTAVTPATQYSRGRGYGLKDARIWRAFDALQPDPLYQDFICIESGGFAVDVPNGKYRVFVNIDSPSGYWGEYQRYHERAVKAEGRPVVHDTMDFDTFKSKYFRFWNVDDLPSDNTFDRYQKSYFHEKRFDVDVTDGQLNLEFQGESWACSVSAVVIFPVQKAAEGEAFLKFVEARRRFYFDNYFKRVLPSPAGDRLQAGEADERRGFVVFQRDPMQGVSYNDLPASGEVVDLIRAEAFAGEYEPVTIAVVPLRDLGRVHVSASDLIGPASTIPASAIDVGYVSYRLSRVTSEGTVYTIAPRLIMPGGEVAMPRGITRRFWLTARTPADAGPGLYKGTIAIRADNGGTARIALELRVCAGTLDPVDIPAGPFGYTVGIPWYDDDPRAADYNQQMVRKSLQKMRDYGFTACTGLPSIAYRGFDHGKPVLDFGSADASMRLLKQLGFLAVTSYGGGVSGYDPYGEDTGAMNSAGFTDYTGFVKAIHSAIAAHAAEQAWIPVYYNLADEPIGDDLVKAGQNAESYRRAFPAGPPYFTGASSFKGGDRKDPHYRLASALTVVSWNDHDEPAVSLLHNARMTQAAERRHRLIRDPVCAGFLRGSGERILVCGRRAYGTLRVVHDHSGRSVQERGRVA